VQPAFDRLAEAVDDVRRDNSRSVISVNAPPTFTMKWLIPRLSSFHRNNRDIDVRLSTGIGPPDELEMNKFDIVIRRLAHPEIDARSTPFLASTLLAVCAPELIERRPIASPQDLLGLPLIEAATSSVSWADWFTKAGFELPPNAKFNRFEQMFFAVEAALDGLGVALLPSALVIDDLAARRLVLACNLSGVYERDYSYILSPFDRTRKVATLFGEWLSQQGKESNQLGHAVIGGSAGASDPRRKESPPSPRPKSPARNGSRAPREDGRPSLRRGTRSNRRASH
jgi:LysR family glycine cleavage system transcriptional activator